MDMSEGYRYRVYSYCTTACTGGVESHLFAVPSPRKGSAIIKPGPGRRPRALAVIKRELLQDRRAAGGGVSMGDSSADAAAGGFLARVHCPQPHARSSVATPPDDLLLALTRSTLQVFARKTRNLGCTCLSDTGDALLASGFHCPHLHGSADYWPTGLAVDTAAIRQVLVTYRTVDPAVQLATEPASPDTSSETEASSVAARTRDCVLVFSPSSSQLRRVRLEFEHNLARGVFVDAVTAATNGQVEVDYIDALDLDGGEEEDDQGLFPRSSVGSDEGDELVFHVRRSALRSATVGKISLALQITGEGEQLPGQKLCGDTNVQLLLGSAMSMAQALDEPDVLVLSWLVSGFINAQRALPSRQKSEKKAKKVGALALAQLRHASKLAREHCLPLLLSLSLQCSADLLVSSTSGNVDVGEALEEGRNRRTSGDRWRLEMARQWLTEAALLLPKETDAALKMQLHRKIADLSAILAALFSDGSCDGETSEASPGTEREEALRESRSDFTARALNLWALLLDPIGGTKCQEQQQQQQFGGLYPLAWLLSPPLKRADQQYKPSVCCVQVLNPFAASATATTPGDALVQQPDVQRVRIFFTSECDVEWLQSELTRRLRQCPSPFLPHSHEYRASSGSGDGVLGSDSALVVCALFDSTDGGKRDARALLLTTRLSAVVATDGHVLTAEVALEAATREGKQAEDTLTVLCSQCHARVALEDAEAHSETCC